jgi:hypothetical protein
VIVVVTAATVPQALASLDHDRAVIAARYISSRMALARMQAVSHSANVALRFEEGASTTLSSFVDGNHDGVLTREILTHVDPPLDAAVPLGTMFPGVLVSLAADAVGDATVRPGVSTLVSFAPSGTATSGSVYVTGRDGSRYAVRVLGVTGRTRILRYDAASRAWVPIP